MIKQTVYIGNPARLHTERLQLVIEAKETGERNTLPIEDIGFLVMDNPETDLSHSLITRLMENNVAIIACGSNRHPIGMMIALEGNTLLAARHRQQISAPPALLDSLWGQTVRAKLRNQAAVLEATGNSPESLRHWAGQVGAGDKTNLEGRGAARYWKILFGKEQGFVRERFGAPPNNLLNYAYALLRAALARAIVGAGLLHSLGIHHRNQYNAFALADDLMEPYRPYADGLVYRMVKEGEMPLELLPAHKRQLLGVLALPVCMEHGQSPLMVAVGRTAATLAQCYGGRRKTIAYPKMDG